MVTHSAVPGLGHYLVSFIAYTLLAVGAIYAAFLYLKSNPRLLALLSRRPMSSASKEAPLSIETMLPLEARKSLYIIRSGQERFLIATSAEGTQFLSKLDAGAQTERVADTNRSGARMSRDAEFNCEPSVMKSEEVVIPMRSINPVVSNIQRVRSVQQTFRLLLSKLAMSARERFDRLQYQFEKTSSNHW